MFTFGDAAFRGSLGSLQLNSPILSITATPSGNGYWLAAADGGVFAFGDAEFHGAATGVSQRPIVGMASTPSGHGYYLLASDGGVFAFGDAAFRGAAVDAIGPPATAIAASPDGAGYWVLRQNGIVHPFAVPAIGDIAGSQNPAVGIARAQRRLLDRAGQAAPAARGGRVRTVEPRTERVPRVHVCARERPGRWLPRVNPSGTYRGAYQFSRSTWDNTARHAGRSDLVGVDPAAAAPADQDFLAFHLYQWQGAAPWGGRCAGK